jgi:hypothetical protein
LTEREADLLCRLAKEGSLSVAVRQAITSYIAAMGGAQVLQDTDDARLRRERRKAKRMTGPEGAAQVEAEAEAETAALEQMLARPALETRTIEVTRVSNPYEGKVINISVAKASDPEVP